MPKGDSPPAIALSGLDTAELAEAVGGVSDEQLREVMVSDLRAAVLEEVFNRFPDFVDSTRTRDVRAAIEWRIAGCGRAKDRFIAAQLAGVLKIPGAEE